MNIREEFKRAIEIWQEFLIAYSDEVILYGISY